MKIYSSLQFTRARIVATRFQVPGMIRAALFASAALFLLSGTSFAQGAAKRKPATARESNPPSVSEGVASNPSSSSPARTTAKPAAPMPAAASAMPHAPAVAYLLLQSAQGIVNGGATDAMHRNWIAVSAIDKGSLADGAAKGQASDAAYKESSKGGVNPLYEPKDAIDHKNISDGAAKGQASDAIDHKNISDGAAKGQASDAIDHKNISDGAAKGQASDAIDHRNISDGAAKGQASDAMDHRNISDGAAKGQASDATAPGFPALDAASKDAAKMAVSSGSSSGSVVIMKERDETSPLLARAAASGSHFSFAQIDVLDGGIWRHYQLSDVTVSSVQPVGGGSRPFEQIHLSFTKIEMK